jgi:hypothetical protein
MLVGYQWLCGSKEGEVRLLAWGFTSPTTRLSIWWHPEIVEILGRKLNDPLKAIIFQVLSQFGIQISGLVTGRDKAHRNLGVPCFSHQEITFETNTRFERTPPSLTCLIFPRQSIRYIKLYHCIPDFGLGSALIYFSELRRFLALLHLMVWNPHFGGISRIFLVKISRTCSWLHHHTSHQLHQDSTVILDGAGEKVRIEAADEKFMVD